MKSRTTFVYALLALLLLAACQAAGGSAQGSVTIPASRNEVPRISPQELKALQDAGEKVVIADARSLDSYELQHIAGAISVPALEVADHVDELPKRAHIVFYCTWPEEDTSARAALNLYELELGYKNISALLGGMEAWKEAGYPVE